LVKLLTFNLRKNTAISVSFYYLLAQI